MSKKSNIKYLGMEGYVLNTVVRSNASCNCYIGKAISNHKVSQIIVNAHHFCLPNDEGYKEIP
jgi:hypothetical protein